MFKVNIRPEPLVMMQTVRIESFRTSADLKLISTDGQDHGFGFEEEESGYEHRPPCGSLHGPAAVTLVLSCKETACNIELAYHALYSPGARCNRGTLTRAH